MTTPLLAHTILTADGATPSRWVVFLHGVFGMGLNFRTFAKALVAERPAWGAVLVDLRGHGASPPFAPPHTLAAAAADVERLIGSLAPGGRPIRAAAAPVLVGHSLGGKTVLAYLKQFPGTIDRALVLDSLPGGSPDEAAAGLSRSVLKFLEGLPGVLPSRDAFTSAAKAAGFASAVVEWLAMNVRRSDAGYALRLDLGAIRALLLDFRDTDLWDVIEDASYVEHLDLVIAGASTHYGEAARGRAEHAVLTRSGLTVHVVEGAGHWLHVDAPESVRAIVRAALDSTPPLGAP